MERLKRQHRQSPVSTGWNPLANLDFAAEVVAAAPPTLVPFNIHGEEFEEAGATAVEEVGFTLAAAIDFMAGMQERKVDAESRRGCDCFFIFNGRQLFLSDCQAARLPHDVGASFRELWGNARKREGAHSRPHLALE